jgi:HEAT repeat protein
VTDNRLLLTDTQMQHFLQHGYLTLRTQLPPEFHREIYRRTEDVFAREGNLGNNILPRIPELHQVFADPVLSGGLASLLGPSYIMHSHRHCHINPANSKGGGWHKDSYWGFHRVRSHRTRWVMIFYYPQDTVLENGPTAVMPGTQCYEQRAASEAEEVHLPVCGEAGTATLVHFDLWHRATPNLTPHNRYMMKFQFTRMEEPTAPCWNHQQADWQDGPVATQLWQWHLGRQSASPIAGQDTSALALALRDSAEPVRLRAAYTLGAAGSQGVPALIEALGSPAKEVQLDAAYGLALAGQAAVPALTATLDGEDEQARGCAAYALGDMGPQAGGAAGRLARQGLDPSPFVRRHVAEALGTIAGQPEAAVPALEKLLRDEDPQTRFNAAYALAHFGVRAEGAVPALAAALEDDNRYVRNHSAEALRHIGTPVAQQALMDFLMVSRWCPITTKESTF